MIKIPRCAKELVLKYNDKILIKKVIINLIEGTPVNLKHFE